MRRDHCVERADHFVFLRDVERVAAHLDAAGCELGAGRVEVGLVEIEQRKRRAAFGECMGDGLADSARAARDDRDLAVQLHGCLRKSLEIRAVRW